MKVLDSCGWIEYFVDGPLADEFAYLVEHPDSVVTPAIVVYEVYKKIQRDGDTESALAAAAAMQRTFIMPLDDTLAMAAADASLYYKLPTADAIVYATAQALDAEVVTSDAHFEGLPGVRFIPKP